MYAISQIKERFYAQRMEGLGLSSLSNAFACLSVSVAQNTKTLAINLDP